MTIRLGTKENQVFEAVKDFELSMVESPTRQDIFASVSFASYEVSEYINSLIEKEVIVSVQGGKLMLYKNAYEEFDVSDKPIKKTDDDGEDMTDAKTIITPSVDEDPDLGEDTKPKQVEVKAKASFGSAWLRKRKKKNGTYGFSQTDPLGLTEREREAFDAMRDFKQFGKKDISSAIDVSLANADYLCRQLIKKNAIKQSSLGIYVVANSVHDVPEKVQVQPSTVEQNKPLELTQGNPGPMGDRRFKGENYTKSPIPLINFNWPKPEPTEEFTLNFANEMSVRLLDIARARDITLTQTVETLLKGALDEYDRQEH